MRKIHLWQIVFIIGLIVVLSVLAVEITGFPEFPTHDFDVLPYLDLIGGILLIAGASEAFVLSVEGIAHHMKLTDYVSGIYASLAATIPELSVLAFLILQKEFELAWILALATIFVNTLVFAAYSLVLPKDEKGNFRLPDAIMWVGSDLLTVGAVISLAVGLSMILLQIFVAPTLPRQIIYFTFDELIVFGGTLIGVFIAYLYNITKYYGRCDPSSDDPAVECKIRKPVSKATVATLLVVASAGALLGGEAVATFANFAQEGLGLNFVQAALLLVVFGGLPEYIIVASSHAKAEIEIALSNAFGGIVQVFFVVFGFTLIASGLAFGKVPVDLYSVVLVIFAFPTLLILRTTITDDAKINNLEAIAMIAVFVMMLYILLVFGNQTVVHP